MDAFYASVEQRDNPSLRGKPLIVGGDARRGVVLAASYEVRPFGVRSAMPMAQALRLCPHAIVRPPDMRRYGAVSRQLMALLGTFSPFVEPLSVDEAFLDVTGQERLFGAGRQIALALKRAIREALELCASVGVASSKFVAKVASDLEKPDGLVVVEPGHEEAFLAPLAVGRLYGVGKKTEARLAEAGLHTIGALAACGPELLGRSVGLRLAATLGALARGQDDRPVIADRAAVTVGSEETLEADTADPSLLRVRLLAHADRVAERLRAAGYVARVVVLKVKLANFTLRTRRLTLPVPTAEPAPIAQAASALLGRMDLTGQKLRLIGVAASGLAPADTPGPRQLELLPAAQGDTPASSLGRALDAITERFGEGTVRRASLLEEE